MEITAAEIGRRIHALRQKNALSLREMAQQSGLTASFLSQVERGVVNSSIESLRRITNSLGVTMVQLLDSEDDTTSDTPLETGAHAAHATLEKRVVTYSPVIVRANNRPKLLLPTSGVTIEMLTSSRAHKAEVFLSRLAPGTEILAQPLSEATEQFVFVLTGALRIELAHADSVLDCGDAIYYDGATVQRFACVGDLETSWICMITPPVF